MRAPDKLIQWLRVYVHQDRTGKLPIGLQLQYHSRSDHHSTRLAHLIVEDLLDTCEAMRQHAAEGRIAYGVNYKYEWSNGKSKTLDLAIGKPGRPLGPPAGQRIHVVPVVPKKGTKIGLEQLLIACELKAVMTEHRKSEPRIFSELNDAHTNVHQGNLRTIAAGVTMINIAKTFVSATRQSRSAPVKITRHDQPRVTEQMLRHLRRLPIRDDLTGIGFDAYCNFVVDLDNQGHVSHYSGLPAPQPGDPDHYETFLQRICSSYKARFPDPTNTPAEQTTPLDLALIRLEGQYPGLLEALLTLAEKAGQPGASQLRSLLSSFGLTKKSLE